jgi:hypothetical protein
MAAVFTFVVAIAGFGLFVGLRGYIRRGRNGHWLLNPYLPLVIVWSVFASYLAAKIAYGENYPCVAVDPMCCTLSSP